MFTYLSKLSPRKQAILIVLSGAIDVMLITSPPYYEKVFGTGTSKPYTLYKTNSISDNDVEDAVTVGSYINASNCIEAKSAKVDDTFNNYYTDLHFFCLPKDVPLVE